MSYRDKLYSNYVSSHTSHLYGEATIEGIKKQFPVWERYFGRFLPDNRNARILDIGCGNGGFVYFLQSSGYKNSQGIDISREQVEESQRLGIPNIECVDLSEFLRGKERVYDIIIARDIIEHFKKEEIIAVLTLVFNSLKEGGVLVIQTPNAESPFGSRYRYWDFTHEIAFTRSSLNQVLRAVGFNDTAFYPAGPVPKGFKSAVRFLLWKGIEAMLRFYMLVETGTKEGIFTQNIIAIGKK
jgi:2-polyprenyl-3-methyl-5-hydroxy-6-metoxy-1,4-benzoquinol methylase